MNQPGVLEELMYSVINQLIQNNWWYHIRIVFLFQSISVGSIHKNSSQSAGFVGEIIFFFWFLLVEPKNCTLFAIHMIVFNPMKSPKSSQFHWLNPSDGSYHFVIVAAMHGVPQVYVSLQPSWKRCFKKSVIFTQQLTYWAKQLTGVSWRLIRGRPIHQSVDGLLCWLSNVILSPFLWIIVRHDDDLNSFSKPPMRSHEKNPHPFFIIFF